MSNDTRRALENLAEHLFVLPMGDYLRSEDFSSFCKQHDLEDLWKEYLVLSRDRPDLYGHFVIQNALARLLHHVFHSRPDEFLEVITHFLIRASDMITRPLSISDLKSDLTDLGYSASDLESVFAILNMNMERNRRYSAAGNPDSRFPD